MTVTSKTVTSIHSLPNELLAHTFAIGSLAQCLSDTSNWPTFPIVISHVSRKWREVAISSPPVWCNLFFTDSESTVGCYEDLFLPRSGTHPLNITVDVSDGESSRRILPIILPHILRWWKLSITVRDVVGVCRFLHSLEGSYAPLLRHFHFCCYDEESTVPSMSSWTGFTEWMASNSNHLSSFKIRGVHLEHPPLLHGLTALHFISRETQLKYNEISKLISSSPSLETLVLHMASVEFPTDDDVSIIPVPSLRSLAMRVYKRPFSYLLTLLAVPALECLEIVSTDFDEIVTFVDLFDREGRLPQFHNVHTLKLFYCGHSPGRERLPPGSPSDEYRDTLKSFSQFFPAITSLHVVACVVDFFTFPSARTLFLDYVEMDILLCIRAKALAKQGSFQYLQEIRAGEDSYLEGKEVWDTLRSLVTVVELGALDPSLRYIGQTEDDAEERLIF